MTEVEGHKPPVENRLLDLGQRGATVGVAAGGHVDEHVCDLRMQSGHAQTLLPAHPGSWHQQYPDVVYDVDTRGETNYLYRYYVHESHVMTMDHLAELEHDFRETLIACRRLYRRAAQLCIQQHPEVVRPSPDNFVQMMEDLHSGLVVKIYFEMCLADRRWSRQERRLAHLLFEHVWGKTFEDDQQLREVAIEVSAKSQTLDWYSLIRPFAELAPLREYVSSLETVVVRLANLVAKADGTIGSSEAQMLLGIQHQLETHLHRIPLDDEPYYDDPSQYQKTIETLEEGADRIQSPAATDANTARVEGADSPSPSVEDLIRELENLVGLDSVKQEVRTLSNFLFIQQQRLSQGLPATPCGLHMVFTGNPGTGKTTVARLIGRILGAMKILKKGHLVECDRSGLVADFLGQTSNKTNRKIDEALDGILFIDEAYSLVARTGEDAYGHEALQTLLKRMEDDRNRLVVIVAGYPEPMERLLQANPGFSSRFQRTLHFEDYGPLELCHIFGGLCQDHQYELTPELRAKLLVGMDWIYKNRDEHFGNGRMIRNLFEHAVRCLANRIATVAPLTHQLLTRLEAEDVPLNQLPSEIWHDLPSKRFILECPGCRVPTQLNALHLASRVKCKRCEHVFVVDWAVPQPDSLP